MPTWTKQQYEDWRIRHIGSTRLCPVESRVNPDALWIRYQECRNIHIACKPFGISGETGRKILIRNGHRLFNSGWTDEEKAILVNYYETTPDECFDMSGLSAQLNRSKDAVFLMASKLGVTNSRTQRRIVKAETKSKMASSAIKRTLENPEYRETISSRVKEWHRTHEHPKGMLGRKHTDEAKQRMSIISQERADSMTVEQRKAIARKGRETRSRNGTSLVSPIQRGSWKSGWVVIGGKRFFSRSSWEVDYAKFLEWQKIHGLIQEWEYEAFTLWFPVKRGVTNYTPDFRVVMADGEVEFHEVKGWMDKKSATKIKRTRIYYPRVKMRVIDAKWFKMNKDFINGIK